MRSTYLLVREDLDRSYYALMSDAEPSELLSSIVVPAGADNDAVLKALQGMARLESAASASTVLRADARALGRAAGRCADALAVPVRILDIAYDAGRSARAVPGSAGEVLEVLDAALVPLDPTERRRRCDAVLRMLGEQDRAAIADRLGDIAERPVSGRDAFGDRVRSAAFVDALRSLAEVTKPRSAAVQSELLVVTGQLAGQIATGEVPLAALAVLVSVGRTTVVLDRAGVFAALGTEQLTEVTGVDLFRATASQLLEPAGDLLLVADHPQEEVIVRAGAVMQSLPSNSALALKVRSGEVIEVAVEISGHDLTVALRGGVAGASVLRGWPVPAISVKPSSQSVPQVLAFDVPLTLLSRSAGATGGLGGRLLLGDEVEGRLHFSAGEPDSRGWASAYDAGILAVASVSPETVLRARAVGIRGLVVGSLSDGEREALSASIDRRVAAGVALAPFGLLILGGRRESESWSAELGKALQGLHGQHVELQRHPAGFTAREARGGAVPPGSDTVVIGGPRAGSYGLWRGLTDAPPSDPLAALEINGELVALPLGDLQRLTA